MPETLVVPIKDISLDLGNFRLLPQADEQSALSSLIQSSPDYYWAVAQSLLDDGYLPTENVVLIKDASDPKKLIVKEGNKRVSILKLIHGLLKGNEIVIPTQIEESIKVLPKEWFDQSKEIPCVVFEANAAQAVDKIVSRAHGKGEKSGREAWNTVARARHNRQINGKQEIALDFLEAYLQKGLNLNSLQKDRWSATYPLPLLDEVTKKIAPRLGYANAPEIVKNYPGIPYRNEVESILRDIGLETLTFSIVRSTASDFAADYGIPQQPTSTASGTTSNSGGGGSGASGTSSSGTATTSGSGSSSTTGTGTGTGTTGTSASGGSSAGGSAGSSNGGSKKETAYASNDPRHVTKLLKQFTPKGTNRAKVVTLRNEALKLKIKDTPLAFCFVLRSLFEVSAKAYADDHPTETSLAFEYVDNSGKTKQRKLADVLGAIVNHVTGGNMTTPFAKTLQGAQTELARKDGILSVTTLNQLVHSPTLSIIPSDICTLFTKVFPLLEAMNS